MKINNASIVALAALLAVSMAAEDPTNNKPNLRREVTSESPDSSDDTLNETKDAEETPSARGRKLNVPLRLHFNRIDCNKKMVDVEVCFKTDDYPHENIVWIEDEDGEVGFEMGPFSRKDQMYCEDEQFCPGKVRGKSCRVRTYVKLVLLSTYPLKLIFLPSIWIHIGQQYWLYVDDSYGDGTSHSYGEVIVRTRDKKMLDMTLYNFSSQYGPRKFVVEEENGGNTNTRTNTRTNTNTNGRCNGPFGSCNCRECKDECADRNKGDSWGKKRCKTDVCRVHYGKSICKD